MAKKACGKPFLHGYFSNIVDDATRARYLEKLGYIDGKDPYEILETDWNDDVDSWPGITHIHIGMYLLLKKSSYTSNDLLNYKSIYCYVNFTSTLHTMWFQHYIQYVYYIVKVEL